MALARAGNDAAAVAVAQVRVHYYPNPNLLSLLRLKVYCIEYIVFARRSYTSDRMEIKYNITSVDMQQYYHGHSTEKRFATIKHSL
jgi:hypothetical protein